MIIHFHLHNPIMIGKKKTKDVQFYVEVMEASYALDQTRRSGYDPDELEEEQRERAHPHPRPPHPRPHPHPHPPPAARIAPPPFTPLSTWRIRRLFARPRCHPPLLLCLGCSPALRLPPTPPSR